jgi:hypothetical protein
MLRTGAQACARAISMQVVAEGEDNARTTVRVRAQSRSREEAAMIGPKVPPGTISWSAGVGLGFGMEIRVSPNR